jgi:O-antigen ligase
MEALIAIAALAGLVWAALFVLRVPLPIACLIFLITSCCCGKYFFEGPAGLTVDRLMLVLVVGTFFVRRGMNWHEPKPVGRADYLLGAFFAWLVIRTFTSDFMAKANEPNDVTAPWHLTVGYVTPLLIYWIARQGSLTEKIVNKLHVGLVLFGGYLAVTGLLESIGAWGLVFPRYIADPEIGIHFGRVRGPMVQSARFGTYLIICLAATWMMLMWRKRLGRTGQLLMVGMLPLYLLIVARTYTRSIWMGTGLAALIILGLTLRGRWRPVVVGYLVVAALLVAFMKRDSLVAFQRDNRKASITRESTYMRAAFAYVSWQMFTEKPLVGFGFNQFPIQSKNYLADRSTDIQLETIRGYIHHNTFLSILVDTGLIGFALFLSVLIGCINCAWKLWRDPDAPEWARAHGLVHLVAMAAYSVQLSFREVSYSPVENGMICLLAGVTIGLRAKLAAGASRPVTRPAPTSWNWQPVPSA